ncbi:hypothetical protein [Bosea sp. NBC_00550]|uniref:hypothetical protein n=1 Tax=Bosea sp. NBC_00550 TaxID=2969621 RepID=UPI0022305240|nr:hypothetical protein [Bosea sp. NBC_00550]UZF92171.1 hypothetical protein NWE53_24405 [Bosea sp. NBC_00550]
MRFIMQHWQDRQRQIDIEILWPACFRNSRDIDCARLAFAIHAQNDPAWTVLGTGEILRQVALLLPPRPPAEPEIPAAEPRIPARISPAVNRPRH